MLLLAIALTSIVWTSIILTVTVRMMPQQPATSTRFALGLAIIIGNIPVLGGFTDSAVLHRRDSNHLCFGCPSNGCVIGLGVPISIVQFQVLVGYVKTS